MNFFPVCNLLLDLTEKFSEQNIDDNVTKQIDLAQRDHVSVTFQHGIIRTIVPNVDENEIYRNDVADGSFTQWLASKIANERNLQCHLMFRNNQFSLVVISSLDGPKDNIDLLSEALENFEII